MRVVLRIVRRLAIAIGAVFIVAVVFLLYALKQGIAADWVREDLMRQLHESCAVSAKFDSFTFDAFPPEVTMTGLVMDHLDGRPMISVDEAIISLQVLPLFARRVQLDRVAVLRPSATIELLDGKMLNLPKCLEPKDEQQASGVPIALGIRELAIERGKFDLIVDQRFAANLDGIDLALEPRRSSSGSSVRLAIDDSQLSIDQRPLVLHRLRVLGHLEGLLTSPRAVVLELLEASLQKIDIRGTGSVDLFGPVYEAKLAVATPLDSIHDFLPDFPATEGDVFLEVSVSGTLLDPRAAGKVVIDNGKVDTYEMADKVLLDFSADKKAIDVPALEIRLADGTVKGKARVELDEKLSLKAEIFADSISIGRVLDAVGVEGAWVDFRTRGRATGAGTLNPVDIGADFSFDVKDFTVFDRAYSAADRAVLLDPGDTLAEGHVDIDDRGASFRDCKVSSGDTFGTANVRLNADSNVGLALKATLSTFDFKDVGGAIGGIAFGGAGTLSAEIGGPYSELKAQGTLALDGVTIVGIPFGYARSEVAWHDDTKLDFKNISGKLAESNYAGDVSVDISGEVPFTLKGTLGEGRMQDLLLPFHVKGEEWGDPKGKITRGAFDLKGPITLLSGPIDLEFKDASIVGEQFEVGRAVGRFEKGAIILEDLEIDKHGATIFGKGRLDPNGGDVRARLSVRDMTLQKLDIMKASMPGLDAKMKVAVALDGHLSRGVTGTVDASFKDGFAGPMPVGGGALAGTIRGHTLALKGKVLKDQLDVDGEIDLLAKLPYRATLTMEGFDVPKMLGSLRGTPAWAGEVSAKAKLFGSLIDWPNSSGEITLDSAIFDSGGVRLETAAAAKLELDRGVVETKRLVLTGPRTRLTVGGKIGGSIIALDVDGKIDLTLLEAWSPSVERAGGTLSIDSAVEGTPANLNLIGTGKISGGILQWRGFDERLSAISADLTFSQSTVLVDRAEARWADGKLSASGSVVLEDYAAKNFSLSVLVEEVFPRLSYPTVDVSGLLNGALTVEGSPTRFAIRGDLDVERGRGKPNIELADLVQKRRWAVNVYDPSAEVLELDVGLHVSDSVRVKNDWVDLELKGDLRLTGTNQRLGYTGTVTVQRGGRVKLPGREYELISGSIDFQDRYRFYPRYDLNLRSDACGAQISLNIVGTLEETTPSYTSNPEMDEENIKSCLLSGVPVSQLDTDLAKFASGALWKFSGIDREVKKVLPVDEIDVSTEWSSQTRAYEPRVLVAKELTILGSPARLEYTSSLSGAQDQEVRLRYRITPRLTLQGAWAETKDIAVTGDLGLDLKYRWEW